MGNAISIQHPVIDDLLNAVGLKDQKMITNITLIADCNNPVKLHIIRLIEDNEAKELVKVFEQYELTAVKQEDK